MLSPPAAFLGTTADPAKLSEELGVPVVIALNQFDVAENMLGAGTSYAKASSALGVAFLQMRKEAGI